MPQTPPWSMHGTTAVARASALIIVAAVLTIAPARAEVQTFENASAPIVRVNVRAGDVTIRTWDRPSVQVDADPSLVVTRRTFGSAFVPASIPIPAAEQASADGPVSLAPESFVVGAISPGPHETIVVRDPLLVTGSLGAPTPVTVMVPNDSAIVFARTGDGVLDVHDYRAGTLVAFVGNGRMQLDNVGGTVFAQTGRGALIVTNSSFDRLRARSLFGNMTFERCDVRQIEATSIDGSIVYDGGSFQAGLAHFESTRGDVAIGANGAVQLGGHTAGDGRVYTNFQRPASIAGHDGEASATIGGGGPVVTATSQTGNVYFYDGSLRTRQNLPAQWQSPVAALRAPAVQLHHEPGGPTSNVPAIFRERFPQYRNRARFPKGRATAVPAAHHFRGFGAFRPNR